MFDRIIVVDWSANSTPKRGRDSLWVCWVDVDRLDRVATINAPTRRAAIGLLETLVRERPDGRTLLGVDFSLGYPRGTAGELGISGEPWRGMWSLLSDLVHDDDRNVNNRFAVAAELNRRMGVGAGPFWGCPPSQRAAHLTSTKVDPAPLGEWRATETALRAAGRRPFSCWQLLGAGSVGSQSLLGIPAMVDLWRRLGSRAARDVEVSIWPFTTGLRLAAVAPGGLVIAEVWPSLVDFADDRIRVRDELQVVALAATLRTLAATGDLAAIFRPDVQAADVDVIVSEEGWVLGAGRRRADGSLTTAVSSLA